MRVVMRVIRSDEGDESDGDGEGDEGDDKQGGDDQGAVVRRVMRATRW